MSDSDLKASRLTATGTVVGRRTRIRAIYNGNTAGSIVVRDGGASGTTVLTLALAANQSFEFPGRGILFGTDSHATLTTVNDITFLYE